jgi:YgiT-type zinc finger domain-containing protein
MEKVVGELVFEESGLTITVGNVPLLKCGTCGEEYVPGPIAEEISDIVSHIAEEVRDAPLTATNVSTTFLDRTKPEPLAMYA